MYKSTIIFSFLIVSLVTVIFLIKGEWQNAITTWAFYGGILSVAVYFPFSQKRKSLES